jgi:hypothetical protein
MIKDFFISFKDNIKDKTTNPFFGTLIVVWTINHWRFIYSLLTFDDNKTLEQRLSIIEKYFASETVWSYLINPILMTFLVIVSSYTLVNISRIIINLFEKRVTPYVYKITDSNSIVLKQDYLKLRKEIENLNDRLERERELKVKAQVERDNSAEKLNNQIMRSLNDPYAINIQEPETNKSKSKVEKIAKKIIDEGYESNWTNLLMDAEKGRYTKYDLSTDFFLKLGLVKLGSKYLKEGQFKLTELGEELREVLNESQL